MGLRIGDDGVTELPQCPAASNRRSDLPPGPLRWRRSAGVMAVAAFAALGLGACGDGETVIAAGDRDVTPRVEPCPEEVRNSEAMSLQELFQGADTWIRLESGQVSLFSDLDRLDDASQAAVDRRSEPPYILHEISGEVLLGEAVPNQVVLQREVAAAILQWFDNREGEILVGITPYLAVGVVVEDGSLGLIGSCYEDKMNPQLDEVFSHLRSTGELGSRGLRDVFLELVAEPQRFADIQRASRGEEPQSPWIELDPATRIVDPGVTPPEELAKLQRVVLLLHMATPIPDGRTGVLCPKTSAGWSPCVSLAVWDDGNPIMGEIYGTPGEAVQLWLLDDPPDVRNPVVMLGETTMQERAVRVWLEAEATVEILSGARGAEYMRISSE